MQQKLQNLNLGIPYDHNKNALKFIKDTGIKLFEQSYTQSAHTSALW